MAYGKTLELRAVPSVTSTWRSLVKATKAAKFHNREEPKVRFGKVPDDGFMRLKVQFVKVKPHCSLNVGQPQSPPKFGVM